MSGQQYKSGEKYSMAHNDLQGLFDLLSKKKYRIIGPTIVNGAIVIDDLASVSDLPRGWTDSQDAANFRLKKRSDEAVFGFSLGPQSWKKYLFPSGRKLFSVKRERSGFQFQEEEPDKLDKAFIGVRPCEIRAIEILDKVFGGGPFKDPFYLARRAKTLIVAVNCGQAGGTCFCVSMGTGPKAISGFDLALTEFPDEGRFLIEPGSEKGNELLSEVGYKNASSADVEKGEVISKKVSAQMGRSLDIANIRGLFARNHDNPRWEAAGKRCLTCGNCTMVCPTCFCSTVEDVTDLSGKQAERWQRWDSCFTMDFSYIHGGSIRPSAKARYRQMVTHKLAHWIDQFGKSGCVGCGRCITWCPAAIDITEETNAIRESDKKTIKAAAPVKER